MLDILTYLAIMVLERTIGVLTLSVIQQGGLHSMNLDDLQNHSVRMVSVSGAGHSGTTLLASMIGNHPEVHLITHETGWFLDPRESSNEALNFLRNFRNENKRATVIVEKTPRHVHHISKIAEEIPGTRFLVMVRNPLDLLASLLTRHQNLDIALDRVITDLEGINAVKDRKDVLVIRYENLVEKPFETIESACNHVRLTFYSELLEWYKSPPKWFGVEPVPNEGIGEEAHLSRRAWQVQQPLFDGRGRWKRDLDSNQYESAKEALGRYEKQWGY